MLVLLLLLTYIKRSTSSGLCPILLVIHWPPAMSPIDLIIGAPVILPAIVLNLWLPTTIAPMAC